MTISTAAAGRRVLFLSAHLPSPTAREAGQRVAFANLKALASRYSVRMVTFANEHEAKGGWDAAAALCGSITVLPVTRWTRLTAVASHPLTPAYVAARMTGAARVAVEHECRVHSPTLVWAEYAQMASYVPPCGAPTVLVVHDVMSDLWRRKAAAARGARASLLALETQRIARWERRWLRAAAHLVALSENDARTLGAHHPSVAAGYPALTVPPGPAAAGRSDVPSVVFFGAMGRAENDDAMRWFLNDVWPVVRGAVPAAVLTILGDAPSDDLRRLVGRTSGVTLTGFVADPEPYLRAAWIGLAPLRLGAGVKVKVLEYMARGIPAVATPVGAEGIDATAQDGLFVASDRAQLGAAVVRLLSDAARAARAGEAATRWIETAYRPRALDADRVLAIADRFARPPLAGHRPA